MTRFPIHEINLGIINCHFPGPPIFPLKEVPEKLYIAGMQPTEIADPNKMSSELKSFIKNSDRDILYMALGTYAVFTDKQFDVVKGAFLKQKRFNVIWSHSAWTEEKDTKDSYDRTRLYIKNKQPQKEIFAHDKVLVTSGDSVFFKEKELF